MGIGVARCEDWRVIGASVAGTSHVAAGLPCQDSCAIDVAGANDDVLILVTSDGAGTAPLSHTGSTIACEAAIAEVHEWVNSGRSLCDVESGDVETWFLHIAAVVSEEARFRAVSSREMACTLALAVVARDGAVFAQIGDGAMVADWGGGYEVVMWPAEAMYANQTYFTTDADALMHLHSRVTQPPLEIAAFTDGLQRLALSYSTRTAFQPFFSAMFARLREEHNLRPAELESELSLWLDSPAVNDRTDDDKTLVLATRVSVLPGVAAGDVRAL